VTVTTLDVLPVPLDGHPARRATLPVAVRLLHPDGREDDVAEADVGTASGSSELGGHCRGLVIDVRVGPLTAPQGPGVPVSRTLTLAVRCSSRAPVTAGLRIEARMEEADDPGWLIPGLFYAENRSADCARRYPRFTAASPDPASLESDWWGFRSDRAATPAVFAWDRRGGVALSVREASDPGPAGVGFANAGRRPYLRLDLPYREEPVSYDGSERPGPPDRRYFTWQPGTATATTCRVFFLGPDRHAYAGVLRALARREAVVGQDAAGQAVSTGDGVSTGDEDAAWVGVAEAADLAAHGLYHWHYRPDPPVLLETAAFDRDAFGATADRRAMHVSWVSGVPYAHALLLHGRRRGNAAYAVAATRVLDHIATSLTPAGTFWGQWTEADGWGPGWTRDAGRLHSRTLADATLFLVRALAAERGHGAEHPAWEAAVRSNLEVVRRSQRDDGALGAAYDAYRGDVVDWRGSAGLAWVAPLAEAGRALGQPGLLAAAARAGAYFSAFVEAEYLCGAPEDVDLAPTSEDGYLALMSYLSLHRETGEGRWLDLARRAADWMLTFRYTYDVSFPATTLLGRYGFRSRGADQASPANQHLHAFGLICLPELVELARAAGDPYYLDMARENLACFRQFIAREDGDFNAWKGMATERYYQTQCFQAKGMILTLSHAWSVGVLLYACEAALGCAELGGTR
jgi:hypothetical protein